MYEIFTATSRVEKTLQEYVLSRKDIKDKLNRLKESPYKSNGAHKLHGKLDGKWACWLGSNIRIIYVVDDVMKKIILVAIGTHKVY